MKPAWAMMSVGFCALGGVATAADLPDALPVKAAVPYAGWSGTYLGAHTGFARGRSGATLFDPSLNSTSNQFGGMIGGLQAGYNFVLPSGLLLGVEADLSFPNYIDSNSIVATLTTGQSDIREKLDYVGTARGRIGYASGLWLAYATGGLAWASGRFIDTLPSGSEDKHLNARLGWAAGAGIEYAFAPHWSARLEYLYSKYDPTRVQFASGAQYASTMTCNRSASDSIERSTGRGQLFHRHRQQRSIRNRTVGRSTDKPPICNRATRHFERAIPARTV